MGQEKNESEEKTTTITQKIILWKSFAAKAFRRVQYRT